MYEGGPYVRNRKAYKTLFLLRIGWLRAGPCLPTLLCLRFLNMGLITTLKNQLALNPPLLLRGNLYDVSVFVYYLRKRKKQVTRKLKF